MDVSVEICPLDNIESLPRYSREGDAGLDLVSTEDLILEPNMHAAVSCGFSIAIPEGYAGLVIPRSGLALNHKVTVLNAPGLIDSNYRGEIKAILINLSDNVAYQIKRGDRIAQLLIVPAPHIVLNVKKSLNSTNREDQGFGSSGN